MPKYTGDLKTDEKERLYLLLEEMKSRGLSVPETAYRTILKWPVDKNGYFSKLDGKFYDPNQNHIDFLKSNARFVALVSGRGGGKTAVGSQKALEKIMLGQPGAVLNPDFENFRIATWPEFREWIPWDMVVPAHRYRKNPEFNPNQPFTMAFMNGVRVICKGLKDPDSARGPNINWLWYDEAGRDKDGLAWQTANASVRVGNNPQAWITTTPKGKNHWIYKFFIKQDIPQDALDLFEKEGGDRELIEVFYTTIQDNIDNLDPGFVAAILATYPVGWLRDQEVYGKFVDETGSLGDRTWFNGKILSSIPESVFKRVVYWDLAGSEKKSAGKKANDPDEFVRTKLSMFEKEPLPKFCIEHQYAIKRPDWGDFKKIFAEWAERDGATVPIYIEEEPGSGGINQVEELKLYIKETLGVAYKVVGHNPKKWGDKVMRANPWFAEASNGQFYMAQGNWNEPCLEQLAGFPDNVDHDDYIDSISGARIIIAPFRTWKNISFLKV